MTPEEVLARHTHIPPTELELRRYGAEAFGWCSYEVDPPEPFPCPAVQMAQRVQAAESRVAEVEAALHKLSTSGDWEAALVRAALAEPRRNALEADPQ